MSTIEFRKVKHLFKSKEDANLTHPRWTSWVSPDLKSRQDSMNNIGPQGWIKVVDDFGTTTPIDKGVIDLLAKALAK